MLNGRMCMIIASKATGSLARRSLIYIGAERVEKLHIKGFIWYIAGYKCLLGINVNTTM
jgi:hypothetical protein